MFVGKIAAHAAVVGFRLASLVTRLTARTALLLGLACVGALLPAAAASATSLDHASAHVAIQANLRYLTASLAAMPAVRQRQQAFAASIATSCPNVLAPLNVLPESAVNKGTVTALGEEIAFDVQLSSNATLQPLLATLGATVERLHWSKPATAAKIKRSFDAQRRFLTEAPSDLCADAQSIASTNAQTTPAPTLSFIAKTDASLKAAGLDGLIEVLLAFGTARDRKALARSAKLSEQDGAAVKSLIESDSPKVLASLGLS